MMVRFRLTPSAGLEALLYAVIASTSHLVLQHQTRCSLVSNQINWGSGVENECNDSGRGGGADLLGLCDRYDEMMLHSSVAR